MRILILGGDGMLGHKMFLTLRERFDEVYCTLRESPDPRIPFLLNNSSVLYELDVMRQHDVCDLLRDVRPDVIVNCTGVIKGFSKHHESSFHNIMVNAALPHQVARLCAHWGGRLITFSSDCIFDGATGGYTEESKPDSPSLYGRTKHLGEVASMPNALTLRTSLIGRELKRFKMLLEWFLSTRGQKIKGFRKALWSGVSNIELAKVVADLIERHPKLCGLYHVTSYAQINKYELLKRLRTAYDLNVEIEPDDRLIPDKVCDRSMNGDKFAEDTGYTRRYWADMAEELADDPTPYGEWRSD